LGKTFGILAFVPALLLAGTISQTVATSPEAVSFDKYAGFDVIELDNGITVTSPGEPALPCLPVTLVIPAGADVKSVTVRSLASTEIPGAWHIVPSQVARPLSKPAAAFTEPNPTIYGSAVAFPSQLSGMTNSGNASGFRLVSVNVNPLQYSPASGRLTLHHLLSVTVDYSEGSAPVTLTPGQRDRAAATLVPLVKNANDLERFSPPVATTDLPEVNYLIITADALAPSLQAFADYRSAHGLRAEIVTEEWIARNYPGRDVQEKTRNLVIDYFQHRGLSYVLLAGDNAQVPCRRIRLSVFDEQGDIPTDMYFGDLDYSWDSNHNNLFGEMSDSMDLFADVLVGRASVDNVHQVENFIRKVAIYENEPATDYIKRSLLPSGWLWRESGYHGKFVNDSIADLTPAPWVDRKMENPPSATVVADSFNHGFAIFDPAGHGNSAGVYDQSGTPIYLAGNAGSARNYRRFSIMTSLACDPGDFEAEDCCAEAALNCDTAGCIGAMMNSRYGWGTPPSMGPSEKLCVRYFDWYFNHSSYIMGACHDRSREAYSATAHNDALWRWCVTEFNLLGDPAIDVWTDTPQALTVEAPASIPTGSQDIAVTVRRAGSPLAGAPVTAWKAGEVFATGTTNGSGQVTLPVHAVTTGNITITATRHDCLPGAGAVEVTQGASEPMVVYSRSSVDDGGATNPNGILEPGETGQLTLVIRNSGTAAATGTHVVLRPITADVTVPDSIADYGTVSAGDTAAAGDLAVAVGGSVYPGSEIRLLCSVATDQGSFEFVFGLDVGYPGRACAEVDTGACALTVTARGSIGFDRGTSTAGRGFRYPKTDTSMLNTASFALATDAGYAVDRFYTLTDGVDADWQMADSVRSRAAIWQADEMLTSAFNDNGHPAHRGISVNQRALGIAWPDVAGAVVLVYDVVNNGTEALNGAYAGILADFDVKATDRFHDCAYTLPWLDAVMMRSAILTDRFCGMKLLAAGATTHSTCIDNGIYVNPDSGMSESMKFRALTGELGAASSDRPFNWSVALSAGPFDIAPGANRRLGFAFVSAPDSVAFLNTCIAVQAWYNAHVGVAEGPLSPQSARLAFEATPNPTTGRVTLSLGGATPKSVRVFDSEGRLVLAAPYSAALDLSALPAGIYLLRATTADGAVATRRITLVR